MGGGFLALYFNPEHNNLTVLDRINEKLALRRNSYEAAFYAAFLTL